jgi:hypothetical protein
MRALAKLIAAAALAALPVHVPPALAQPQADPHGGAPQVAPGQARAEGDALLAAAGAADLFDNLTGPDAMGVRLKHKASGLICEFNAGQAANKVIVFEGAPRGDAVACATGGQAGERTLYATRAPGRTLDDAFAHDLAEVKRGHPGAETYSLTDDAAQSPILGLLNTPPMPKNRTARFIAEHNFTSVSSAVVGDWSLEFRYTCPEEIQDLAAATLQPTLWAATLSQIANVPLDLAPKQAV